MSASSYLITGRITRRDTNAGVLGLRVEAWDNDRCQDDYLGSDSTNADGSFSIRICESDFRECCEGCPEVYLKVRDRDCRLIYDGCRDRHCCEPGTTQVINVSLAPETLWWHLSRPLAWHGPNGPLVPPNVFDDIEEAIGLLGQDGCCTSPKTPATNLRTIICATPQIEGFDQVLRDGWGALQGDLAAASRYRDVLRALCSTHTEQCCGDGGKYAGIVDELFKDACEGPPKDKCRGKCDCEDPTPCNCCGCDAGCGCEPPFISDDALTLLVMAALHVACGNVDTAKRSVLTLLDQFCRFEMLGALHRAAVKALLGDAQSRAHFRDLLEFVCSYCGHQGDSCCPPRHPLPCCETCLDERLTRCLRDVIVSWCAIHCYVVKEVRPARACAGEEILIVGCGFGEKPGRVTFREKGGVGPGPAVKPKSWCDDRITVVVPQGAGCGLSILLPADTIEVCDRFLELRRTGCIEKGFEGTSAEILAFNVKGHADGDCLEPGVPLHIRWKTCAADRVSVTIINQATGATIAAVDPADANGSWTFTGTNFARTVRLRVRITATGKCDPPTVTRTISFVIQHRPDLSIQGLEVTQAIQHYRSDQHLTDPADRGPDNSLRLVTSKTAWVRAYLRSGQDPSFEGGQLPGVDGTLRVERRVGGVWSTVATIPSQNGPMAAQGSFVSYDAERGNIDTTLNFVVPANVMTGLLRLTADVASEFKCPGNAASRSVEVDVNLTQTLNAAFVTIAYNGPDDAGTTTLNLPAPSLADCQAETSWAMTTYPLSGTPNVRLAGTFTTNTPLNDPRSCDGCCSDNWQPLLISVGNLVALDQAANPGTTWAYYGLINNGIPVTVPGCSAWGATGGLANQPPTYAHEIGHQFGLPHARCGNCGTGNAAYPAYEPYDLPIDPPGTTDWTMASIGEYGLDINNGNIANPNTYEDFMSYCGPTWISMYTHNYFVNIPVLVPQVIPTGSGGAPTRVVEDTRAPFARSESAIEPLIQMFGTIDAQGTVEIASVARLPTRYLRGRGRRTGYVAQLIGTDGRVLAQDAVYSYPAEGCHSDPGKDCGCGCGGADEPQTLLIKAMVSDVAPGASLRIVKGGRGGKVVWEREKPKKTPVVRKATASYDRKKGLIVSWVLENAAKERGEVWLRWSDDKGRTWKALTVGQKGTSVTIDPEQMPSGTLIFQVLAHDGFQTVTATTNAVTLPAKPPAVSILYPKTSARLYADRRLHLFGVASSFAGAPIADDAAVWYIDDVPVTNGFDVWVPSPGIGSHAVRLEVTEGEQKGSATASIEIANGGNTPASAE